MASHLDSVHRAGQGPGGLILPASLARHSRPLRPHVFSLWPWGSSAVWSPCLEYLPALYAYLSTPHPPTPLPGKLLWGPGLVRLLGFYSHNMGHFPPECPSWTVMICFLRWPSGSHLSSPLVCELSESWVDGETVSALATMSPVLGLVLNSYLWKELIEKSINYLWIILWQLIGPADKQLFFLWEKKKKLNNCSVGIMDST